MDKYVIDVPFLLRALLVRGIILQTRPKKSRQPIKYGGTKVLRFSDIKRMCREKQFDVRFISHVTETLYQGYKNYMIKVLLK
jgi:hypothetical protein